MQPAICNQLASETAENRARSDPEMKSSTQHDQDKVFAISTLEKNFLMAGQQRLSGTECPGELLETLRRPLIF